MGQVQGRQEKHQKHKVYRQNIMKVLVKFKGQDFEVPDVSKAMTVRKFRTLVKNVTEVDPKLQSLYFGGKVMHDECDLCDYRIENGYTIILMQRQPLSPIKSNEKVPLKNDPSTPQKEKIKKEEAKKVEEKENVNKPSTSKEAFKEAKDERELTEEERKQKVREELGEDVLK